MYLHECVVTRVCVYLHECVYVYLHECVVTSVWVLHTSHTPDRARRCKTPCTFNASHSLQAWKMVPHSRHTARATLAPAR